MKPSENTTKKISTGKWNVILLWILPLLLVIPNIALCFTESNYSWLDCVINIAIPLGAYYLLFASSSKIGRTGVFFLPIILLCCFQIVLLFLYGENIIAIDMFLNVATTSVSEASELLGNLVSAIAFVCAIYLPALVLSIVLWVKNKRLSTGERKTAAYVGGGLGAVGAIFILIAVTSPVGYTATRKLFPLNVASNMVTAAERTIQSEHYIDNTRNFSFNATASRDNVSPEVYIMVIGETSRAGNWQLDGYKRETNPRLSKRNGLVFFPKVLSESNTTHKSVPLMMSHLSAQNFGDSIYNSKGILEAFGEAGFGTAWFSNQNRNHSLIDYFGEQAAESIFLNDDGKAHYDEELCPLLKKFLEEPGATKRFIVLHTYGSHFNYRDRFPEEYRYFTPDDYIDATADSKEELLNAYDNTLRYTDAVLDKVIATVDSIGVPSAVMYVSDHGEDIFDDERGRFLHASPTPTSWQVHVPMFVWLSDSYRSEYPEKYSTLIANTGKNVSSSRSAFHTLLSLAGVDSPVYDSSAALCEKSYKEVERVYLNDYNEAVPFTETGIRKADMNYLAHARIMP